MPIEPRRIIGIYKITSPSNKIYIGQSVNIIRRWYFYKKLHCKCQRKLYHSLRKYGHEKHKFEIIHRCDKSELNRLEKYYIELYKCFNSYHGLNLLSGGDSNVKMSDETKAKIGAANKGSKNGMYGKKFSKERIERQREINLGSKSYLAKPILNIETGIYYECLREAAETVNKDRRVIWRNMVRNKKNNTSFIYA